MLHKNLIDKIEFEITEIEKELSTYQGLIDLSRIKEPDLIEKTAIASVLHSFYNVIENIIITIVKYFDKQAIGGKNWHKEILLQAVEATDKREPIITEESLTMILDYLSFRHFIGIHIHFIWIGSNWKN